ncbi:hypothetical protein ACUY3K_10120 [Corynebacterium uberis]|uniref:hypothetical protein n=1 Tax=Corynebacterium uberis TaxID=2883169 RepID=UPI001D0B383C|nr:hypothetical protein [Corynebacterium uberis]UDL73615.1 hypothetical protein LH391_11165 [Corynebacterium uberis]UDL75505.1 hypothetical protein LH393_09760 [Corynebacterium uberis]UDL77718.1 hypothetical protein LH394_09745 [Corynebacterium uberis]UDL82134.1 hypothetical protein LH395_09750 [Corynebacterium uberis]UDL84342.1 hypothetical protein LH390_09745 [Corynebacterium uberis]
MPKKNPWANLVLPAHIGSEKIVADCDPSDPNFRELAHRLRSPEKALRLDLPPEPFIGNINTARVLILTTNPGFSEADYQTWEHQELRDAYEENIHSGAEAGGFYFYASPKLLGTSSARWHAQAHNHILQEIAKKLNLKAASVSALDSASQQRVLKVAYERIMHVDFFPYHSKKSCSLIERRVLKSQEYQFHLVECAKARGIPIIVVRPYKAWYEAVESIKNVVDQPQNSFVFGGGKVLLTPQAIDRVNGDGAFGKIAEAVCEGL